MQIPRCKINGIYYGNKKKERKRISDLRIFPWKKGQKDRLDSYIEQYVSIWRIKILLINQTRNNYLFVRIYSYRKKERKECYLISASTIYPSLSYSSGSIRIGKNRKRIEKGRKEGRKSPIDVPPRRDKGKVAVSECAKRTSFSRSCEAASQPPPRKQGLASENNRVGPLSAEQSNPPSATRWHSLNFKIK